MSATLWDSFEDILSEAEEHFLNFRFEKAIEAWEKYFKITAKTEYKKIITQITQNWDEKRFTKIENLSALYSVFNALQAKRAKNEMERYTYDLYKKLIIRIYNQRFRSNSPDEGLEAGIFDYLSGDLEQAEIKLQAVLNTDIENIQARVFLGFAYLGRHDQKAAVACLSENLVLAANALSEDALYLSQFKLLFGKLHSDRANRDEAAWLLTFESWYRGYLIFTENPRFLRVMQQKESNERIMQVKYYSYERYRHFVRCLYIADYTRRFHPRQLGLIHEQENYMQKLDRELFARYRKKRREL